MTSPPSALVVFGMAEGAEPRERLEEERSADFAQIYAELGPRVHRFLTDLLRNRTLAADATQETFVRAFRSSRPANVRMAAWIFGIARNVSLESRRTCARTVTSSEELVMHRSPEAELLDREAIAIVVRALDMLPEDRRAALLLRLDHGLSYDEISAAMRWSLGKTKIEIFRAREALRETYEQYVGGAR